MTDHDFRATVAAEILEHIERGTAPWQKPWDPGRIGALPHNPVTGNPYRGINNMILSLRPRDDPRWMTYRQAAQQGAQVRGGERGVTIEYWQWTRREPVPGAAAEAVPGADGEPAFRTVRLDRPRVFHARVFNAGQIDGLEPYQAPKPAFVPLERAEAALAASAVTIRHDQADRAYYSPADDVIRLPAREAFPNAYAYYATALHEVGHATGHESRLGRPFGAFGGAAYAREELRAEIASAMMARKLGIGHDPAQHAAYADSWLKVLANDPHEIFRAARDAETINDWVLEPTRRPALEQAARDRQAAGARRERESGIMTDDRDTAARHYLRVPYEEKDAAKAAGARWDRKARAWYAPDGVERAPLAAWDTAAGRPAGSAGLAPEAEFAAACADRGLLIEGAPAMDGRWHRVQVEGDAKGQTGGSYRAWRDGRPAGQITNFRAGGTTKWIATGQALSAPDRAALQAEAAATRQDHAAARAKAHEGAARKAFGVWTNAAWAVETPYLRDKQVAAHGVKTDGDGGLIVPIHNIDGQLQSLQFIAADGAKRMLAGGRKTGGMHVIDPRGLLADKGSAAPLLVAEGYATAATLHETTGHPAVVAFDAGNLRAVAVALREKHPARDIVIAADDDRAKGNKSTLDQAEAAAKAAGAKVALPGFTDAERTHGRTDFNDLARAEPHRIQRALAAARHIKPGKAEDRARGIE